MLDWGRFRKQPSRVDGEGETDARPSSERSYLRAADPDAERKIKLRRRVALILLGVVSGAGCVAAFIGEGGFLDLARLRGEIEALDATIEAQRGEVARLEREIHDLEHRDLARERVAREQLGLVRPGEVDFLLPRKTAATGAAGADDPAVE